jgi:pimeloyl-ACP methyl ester carboxylesterase
MQPTSVFKNSQNETAYKAAYEAILARWPVPFERLALATQSGITHIIASGPSEAPPLVLLPGNFDCSLSWFHNVAALSRAHRVYALDTIGDLGMSEASQLPVRREDYANWLAEVFDGLRIRAADLMGISYGGFLAVNFALEFPERAERLVLLCPGLPLAPFTSQWMVRGMPMIVHPSNATARWFIRGASTSQGPDDLLELFVTGIMSLRSTKVMRPSIQKDEWRQLRMPVLLLVGDHEIMYAAGRAIGMARQLIPHIQAELVARAGHFLLADQAEQVNQRVVQFLETATSDLLPPVAQAGEGWLV